jgi:regulator of extracellular matrix RemA (YlzA/DUF370 family)
MKVDSKVIDNDRMWKRIQPVVKEALEKFIDSRRREGQNLADDLKQRCQNLARIVAEIEKKIPEFKDVFIEKFTQRITDLAQKADIDENRLNTEIAIWVDKTDVSEELIRLNSHLKEFNNILESDKPVGRRLDFIVQELNREANTLSSKVSDVGVSQLVIDIKCELEKIREQAQNIEEEQIMKSQLLNIGFGNVVVSERIVAIVGPGSAPIKRLKEDAKEQGRLIDATYGRKTRAIVVTDSNHVILSAINPETAAMRMLGKKVVHESHEDTSEMDSTEVEE